jgi:hypothetical protein
VRFGGVGGIWSAGNYLTNNGSLTISSSTVSNDWIPTETHPINLR